MIKETKCEKRNDITIKEFKSDTYSIYTIKATYMDDRLSSILVYPSKYPYPNIQIVLPSIMVDFSAITPISHDKLERIEKACQYVREFINEELADFITKL